VAHALSFAHGAKPGRKVTVIAAIHGDELNGVRMLHELANLLQGTEINGSLCLVPVANLMGYANHSRYLPDRRDLNRMFPGLKDGSEGRAARTLSLDEFHRAGRLHCRRALGQL
jgi:predicted deacylase